MSTELIKKEDSLSINYEDTKIMQTLQRTVARDTSPEEYWIFANYCKATGLNPLKNEIWCIKTSQRLQLMTGINGYLAIANRHPQFDGMQTIINEQGNKIVSATCRVWRKDRKHPHEATAYFEEFRKNSPTWSSMPRKMIEKVAKCHALREAFPQEMNGLYTEEEMPPEYAAPKQVEVKPEPKREQGEPYMYLLPSMTPDKQDKLLKRGAQLIDGIWYCDKPLGDQASQYLLDTPEKLEKARRMIAKAKKLQEAVGDVESVEVNQ